MQAEHRVISIHTLSAVYMGTDCPTVSPTNYASKAVNQITIFADACV